MKFALRGVLRAAWVFSLLAWAYVVIDRWVNPQFQKSDLSAFVPIPQNLLGILAFVVGFVSFALWGAIGDGSAAGQDKPRSEETTA